jgi:hypothetical protein
MPFVRVDLMKHASGFRFKVRFFNRADDRTEDRTPDCPKSHRATDHAVTSGEDGRDIQWEAVACSQ